MINREITKILKHLSSKFPVIFLTGPRQSGKTTLLKNVFLGYTYINFEDPDTRIIAENDPRNLLLPSKNKFIIDEAQRVPNIFSYIQGIVDDNNISGQFIISGSQNFLLSEKISQSLAGRVAILRLMPFSYNEMFKGNIQLTSINKLLYYGSYPRIYDKSINPTDYYSNYIETYVERDVRQIQQVSNLSTFIRFVKMCAGRVGQLLNYSSLANDCGISMPTAKTWLSILEASYIVFLLQPHYINFNKRLTKMPKLYFYDTGLASYLLNITNDNQLTNHYLRGGLFENFILSEIIKFYYNIGKKPPIYFWRDSKGKEIDCIIEQANKLIPIEIKSGLTFTFDYFKNINYWNKLSKNNIDNSFVFYAGKKLKTKFGYLESWNNIYETFTQINNNND